MLAQERHELILRSLRRHGRLRVADLVAELGVSAITVRRDLAELDSAGLLRRVHGGAIGTGTADQGARGSQLTIGIIVPSAASYYSDVIRGAEAMADRYGARLVLGVSGYDVTMERDRIDKVLGIGVAGLLISTALGDGDAERLDSRLDDIDVPVVLMERAFGFPHVNRISSPSAIAASRSTCRPRSRRTGSAAASKPPRRRSASRSSSHPSTSRCAATTPAPSPNWTPSSPNASPSAPAPSWSTPTNTAPAWSNEPWN
jgi:hypothetical protein